MQHRIVYKYFIIYTTQEQNINKILSDELGLLDLYVLYKGYPFPFYFNNAATHNLIFGIFKYS